MILLNGKPHDLGGGMVVQRILPQVQRRMVGPFIFFDKMGPVLEKANQNYDVRPHPHIGLSTLTYLFEGRIVHRDSVGSICTIEPGDVNWMTAGSGISHSERSHEEDRAKDRRLDGLQFWIALPDESEEIDPSFQNYKKEEIPKSVQGGAELSVVAGEGFGCKSPVKTSSSLLLATATALEETDLKLDFSHFDIGIYVNKGKAMVSGEVILENQLLVLENPENQIVKISKDSHVVIFGGERFKTPRHIWWNLVATSKEKIESAKQRWKSGSFPMVPGETEFIPLPE